MSSEAKRGRGVLVVRVHLLAGCIDLAVCTSNSSELRTSLINHQLQRSPTRPRL